jgi:Cu(I)/Ag(I) efflux system membrane fusion protein
VITGGAMLLAGGLALGYWLRGDTDTGAEPAGAEEPEVLYWYDPMVPDQHFDQPGKSPFMDMELVPKYADQAAGTDDAIVRIDPATVQNLGVRTEVVERGTLPADLVVPGTLDWNQRAAWQVSARAGGVISRLHVRAPFEPVRAGQPLAELIAPEWNAAIAEYRALATAGSAQARALRSAARERLRALGMEDAQIRALGSATATGPTVTLRAPADGVVSAIAVREGQQVAPGTPLMTVNGLDTIWVQAAVPQAQSATVTVGTPVEATVSALPGEVFTGEVEALLPTVDAATRTQTARIVLENPEHRLAPGMFAEVRFAGAAGEAHPLVPDDAVIATGSASRVIVAEGGGRFQVVPVRTGRSAGGKTQILAGLQGGEQVVVSGQFLIDSEASLSGALERLESTEPQQ